MKKLSLLALLGVTCSGLLFSCNNNNKTINVCASDVPHAEVLENCVKGVLKEKGYTLNVTVLDWTIQNDSVANGDYDANYFQHVPYLNTYEGSVELFASCKVHYEPLGIYSLTHNASDFKNVNDGNTYTFEICNDSSNAIRAFQLLVAKGVIDLGESDSFYVNESLTFSGSDWTSANGKIKIKLISEELLVSSMQDYDYALLPCNTAYTGKVDSSKRVAVEDDPSQVAAKANIICARKLDYLNSSTYKAKIDVLTDVMLSTAVSDYFRAKYLGAMTCDKSTQIDLR